jgi:hypothetical protein
MTAVRIGTSPCLDGLLASPKEMAGAARKHLDGVYYDTMVGTGMSGALVVPILAREMGCHFLVVRKPGDGHGHHLSYPGGPGEGMLGHRWLFVDDGIQSGETVTRVREQISAEALRRGHFTSFAGAYLYGEHEQHYDSYYGGPSAGRDGYHSPDDLDDMLGRIRREHGSRDELERVLRSLLGGSSPQVVT